MKEKFKVFYSWQSDISKNKNFIASAIEKAIQEISRKKSHELSLEINLDRDTRNTSGSPAISKTIFDKILESDIFICDVSIINNSRIDRLFKKRLTPNPNVLIELGFAVHYLGWERIICVNNQECGQSEMLPFDLRGHRITSFNGYNNIEKNKFKDVLKTAIKMIIDNYDNIILKERTNSLINHDKGIFQKITELLSEESLNSDIDLVVGSLHINNYYYYKWELLIEYYKASINHFINEELHSKCEDLISSLDDFRMFCRTEIKVPRTSGKTLYQLRQEGVEITDDILFDVLQNEAFFAHKEPYSGETYVESDSRILNLQKELNKRGDLVANNYKSLIQTYKTITAN